MFDVYHKYSLISSDSSVSMSFSRKRLAELYVGQNFTNNVTVLGVVSVAGLSFVFTISSGLFFFQVLLKRNGTAVFWIPSICFFVLFGFAVSFQRFFYHLSFQL